MSTFMTLHRSNVGIRAAARLALPAISVLALGACGGAAPKPAAATLEAPNRAELPKPAAARDWAPPIAQTWTMPNGIDVWFVEQRQAPLISLQLIMPGGGATDPAGKAGLTSMMIDMLDEGAGERSALALNESLQRLATDYGGQVSTDAIYLGMHMLADKLDPSLDVLADIVLRPTFSGEEFERRKAVVVAQALAHEANPGYARSVVARRALFGTGYGGFSPQGIRATLGSLTLDDIKAHYAAMLAPTRAAFIVVGSVDRPTVEKALNRTFGAWSGTSSAQPAAIDSAAPESAIYLIDYPGSAQSSVAVACRTDGRRSDDYFRAKIFNWALGGAFTSRLNLNLREEKGYTYGARSTFNRWKQAGFFWLAAGVQRDATRPSVDEMLKELRDITTSRPLTEAEHREATEGLLLGYPAQFERLNAVAGQLAALPTYDLPKDWLTSWPQSIRQVSIDDARTFAKKIAVPSRFVVVVAGDRAKIEPGLKGLGMPIHLYDAQGNRLSETAAAGPKD